MVGSLKVASGSPLLATVSLLNGRQPVAARALQRRLACVGRVTLFQGTSARARRLAGALARRGFSVSLNLQAG
ncbi:MAG: hypothetical protein ACK5GZ_05215 [Cyanobium sp.]|jgi:hypothetical protein